MRRLLPAFRRDSRGAAAIEFALALPLVLIIHIGAQDVALAFSFQRRLDNCATNIADLTAQMSELSRGEVLKVLDARYPMLQPFSDKRLGIRVSLVRLDADGAKTVWSIAPTGSSLNARSKGSAITLPKELTETEESALLFSEVQYDYQYTFGSFGLSGVLSLASDSFARARGRAVPECKDC